MLRALPIVRGLGCKNCVLRAHGHVAAHPVHLLLRFPLHKLRVRYSLAVVLLVLSVDVSRRMQFNVRMCSRWALLEHSLRCRERWQLA